MACGSGPPGAVAQIRYLMSLGLRFADRRWHDVGGERQIGKRKGFPRTRIHGYFDSVFRCVRGLRKAGTEARVFTGTGVLWRTLSLGWIGLHGLLPHPDRCPRGLLNPEVRDVFIPGPYLLTSINASIPANSRVLIHL